MANRTAMRHQGRRAVLVGVDGSVSAQGALSWAAGEASYRHCPLRIVHAFSSPTIGNPTDMTFGGPLTDGVRSAAEWIVSEAENHARQLAPGIRITGELFVAGAAPTLLREARDAELVVVGSRGLGGFHGLLVGSVSAAVAAHSPCPVIVVRPRPDGRAFPPTPTGRIVVGVDGSDVSNAAIRFAFQEAARRHVSVTAVHAVRPQQPALLSHPCRRRDRPATVRRVTRSQASGRNRLADKGSARSSSSGADRGVGRRWAGRDRLGQVCRPHRTHARLSRPGRAAPLHLSSRRCPPPSSHNRQQHAFAPTEASTCRIPGSAGSQAPVMTRRWAWPVRLSLPQATRGRRRPSGLPRRVGTTCG